jgi:hypothetical protein
MAANELEIVNRTLMRLGESRMLTASAGTAATIVELDTPQGRSAKTFYGEARQETLRAFPWPFATKVVALVLADNGDGEVWEDEWDFAYTYPADALQILRFLTVRGVNDPFPPRYALGVHGSAKVIFTDVIEDEANVQYIEDVSTTTRFPPIFETGLSYCLAAKMAFLVSGDPRLRDWCLQQWQITLSMAQRVEANESNPPPTFRDETSYTRSRFV